MKNLKSHTAENKSEIPDSQTKPVGTDKSYKSCHICIGRAQVPISTALPAILVVSKYSSVSLQENVEKASSIKT
jgi:hypothetical protein